MVQRKLSFFMILAGAMVLLGILSVRMARHHMDTQIERLANESKGKYSIQDYGFRALSNRTGLANTVKARAAGAEQYPGGKWIPLYRN